MYRRASRLCFALLKFVYRSLRQARSPAQLSLAPPEHRPHDPDLGRKSLPLEAHNLVETTRLSIELYCHCATDYRQRKAPGSFPPRALVQRSMINRSGIEVAMDAEAEHPIVLAAVDEATPLATGGSDGCARLKPLTNDPPSSFEYSTSTPM